MMVFPVLCRKSIEVLSTMIRFTLFAICVVWPSVAFGDNICRDMLRDIRTLAKELKGFEHSPSFKTYGFGAGGPHSGWLDRAKKLQNKYKGPFILGGFAGDYVILPGDIVGLGLSKISCVATDSCDYELIADIETRMKKARCR